MSFQYFNPDQTFWLNEQINDLSENPTKELELSLENNQPFGMTGLVFADFVIAVEIVKRAENCDLFEKQLFAPQLFKKTIPGIRKRWAITNRFILNGCHIFKDKAAALHAFKTWEALGLNCFLPVLKGDKWICPKLSKEQAAALETTKVHKTLSVEIKNKVLAELLADEVQRVQKKNGNKRLTSYIYENLFAEAFAARNNKTEV